MTYPAANYAGVPVPGQAGYPPQQYQPVPQHVPGGWGQPQPPQQYAPSAPAAPQGNPAAGLADPTPPPTAGQSPRIQDLGVGRLILIYPKSVEKVPSTFKGDPPGTMKDRMTADLVVLDGAPFVYGGSEIAQRAHDKQCDAPARFSNVWINQIALISACADVLAEVKQGKPGMVLGRLDRGQPSGGQPPWILKKATPEDRAIAIAYLNKCALEGTPPNRVTPLQGGPVPYPAQVPPGTPQGVAYAMADATHAAHQQSQGWGQPAQRPQYAQPQQYLAAPDPGAQYAPAPQSAPPVDPQYAAYLAWQASQTQQSAPPAPAQPQPQQGWSAGV